MFKNLLDLTFQRTGKQAVGFYLAYFLLMILIGGLSGGLYALVTGENDFNTGLRVGNIMVVIFNLALSSTIVLKKNILSFKTLLLILCSGTLALLIGALGGLIPIAYLSTIQKNTSIKA